MMIIMITAKNLVHHEFIGLKVEVVDKSLCGIIIDETKNTFKIEVESEGKLLEKVIPKKDSIFRFEIPSKEIIEIEGKILSIRPEDRIKKRFKRI